MTVANHFSFPLLVADADLWNGWVLLAMCYEVGKWGWLPAFVSLAIVWLFKDSSSRLFAIFPALALPGSILLITFSAVFYALPFVIKVGGSSS